MSPAASVQAQHCDAGLQPDPRRVIARLYLPGDEPPHARSRAGAIVARVLALAEPEVEELAAELIADYRTRHVGYEAVLIKHAGMVSSHLPDKSEISASRTLVLGASFTAEYALEAAALCNPSAVIHPDQSGLEPGQARIALSLRCIGEGHLSSIGFCCAVVGPGASWVFEPRRFPAVTGVTSEARWTPRQLYAVLRDQGDVPELAYSVIAVLPNPFLGNDLQVAITETYQDLLSRSGEAATSDLLRRLVTSAYEVSFPSDVDLSQRVLMPSAPEESNGMEDARFVRFTGDDGTSEYRATYTAYDGHQIAPRLLVSADLQTFRAHRLAGAAARNKGMALFPRLIDGEHWALCRCDGESNFLARSQDGVVWGEPEIIQTPVSSWEVVQVGNCGPPIETAAGWLVLTHGVGPMRTYSIGAILLDLDDPRKAVGRLHRPLLEAAAGEREGYVPNVVYSCGGVSYDGRLWIPYGIGDARIGVASVPIDDLLAGMTSF